MLPPTPKSNVKGFAFDYEAHEYDNLWVNMNSVLNTNIEKYLKISQI